jgi:hypothetical protein
MEITNISNIDSAEFTNQDYTPQDGELLNSLVINQEFGLPEDKVEIHIVSPNGDLLDSIYDFRNYTTRQTDKGTSLYSTIELDPKKDLESFGYFTGQYDITYYFYRQLFQSSEANKFFISEISSDRTEIKISSNNISYNDLGRDYLNFITIRNSRAFYTDFLLNAGNNKTYIGVNIALDNVNTTLPSLYIKLYEPLPSTFSLKDNFWLVENISEPYSFNVNTEFIAENVSDSTPLRGPNINIELAEKTNLTTNYLNLSNLLSTSTTSSYQQLKSWMEEKSIEITVDYNDFNNFVHFSSAQERLENFQYKLNQIQALESDINSLNGLNSLTSQGYINVNKSNIQSKIDLIIEKFDGYEYFLYYESGSNSWPKTNSTKPYINDVPTSTQSKTWFGSINETSTFYGGKLLETNIYDNLNRDYIWNTLPEYIKEDTQNSNLELFVAMMGQHYDYIWTYAKDITDLQVADNRIDFGISKDLVADTLRNFGIKLYTNSRGQDDLYMSLLGIDADYGTLHSTGSYVINNYVTASQYAIPDNDIVKETYKRLYHNLPYLLKTKGTRRGLYSLINCFGIPETILKVKEFGGNKKDQNIIEQFNEKFNYSFNLNKSNKLSVPFYPSNKQYLDTGYDDLYPDTLEFRFKMNGKENIQTLLEQSLNNLNITLSTPSGSYANLTFTIVGDITSPIIQLPFYNNDWWTLNLNRTNSGSNKIYTLTVGNKDSKGIQYLKSSSVNIGAGYTTPFDESSFMHPGGKNVTYNFSGSIQEFRYWIDSIPIDNFKDHILNPQSTVYNGVTGSYNNLIFRLPLGSELDNKIQKDFTSVHPSMTSSFILGGNLYNSASLNFTSSLTYDINHELFLINTPNVGTITEIDEKIRIAEPNLVPGGVLSPYVSVQKPEVYPYTPDLSIVEVAISPQDSINEDIISQLGSFNIDDYIGDPRLNSSNTYPALDELRDFYFKKYSSSQNIFDIIKLLSYFDNSLFKMIKDFVPARTNLSTGLVIKSHILERNKIARHEPTLELLQYSGSIETAFMSGSNGLNLDFNTTNATTTTYISGTIIKNNTDRRELITGELGGTVILAHSQSKSNIVYELNHMHLSGSQILNQTYNKIALNPTLNNVYLPRLSPKYIDVDYAYNPITPVNFNFLTASLFSNLSSSNFPFLNAPVQDSNYTLARHINPRYKGSKLTGALYNVYTPGDKSYGKDPVIDNNSVKFAYFTEITSQSATLNGRSNVNIKYLIDSASNITELTEANKNLFDVQEIFNRTDTNIALDNINQPSKQKSLNGLKSIYAGGFRYEPILINESNTLTSHGDLKFIFEEDIEVKNSAISSQYEQSIDGFNINFFSLNAPISSTLLNTPNNYLIANLSSGIKVNVTRKTSYQGEIIQRVVGSVTLTVKVSPITNQIMKLWSDNGTSPFDFYIPMVRTSGRDLIQTNGIPIDLWDQMKYITIPAGFTAYTEDGDNTSVITGPKTQYLIPNWQGGPGSRGVDVITVISSVTQCTFTNNSNQNSFGGVPTFDLGYGPHNIEEIDGLVVKVTFPIEGLVVLGDGVGNLNVPTNVLLKTKDYFDGIINTDLVFNKLSTSPNIQFTTAPAIDLGGILLTPGQFYYSQTPPTLYLTGSTDKGYISGSNSGSNYNWYFERGNSVESGSIFTYLTASYDLSNLLYNQKNEPKYLNIPFIQNLTTESLAPTGSFDIITSQFSPKKGDLIKFYNHVSKKFPYDSGFEREIININFPSGIPIGSGSNGTGSYENRLVFEVANNSIPNQACLNFDKIDSGSIGHILNFIFLSKVEDETNVIINHEKSDGQTSPGILFPSTLSNNLKNEAGNIVKNLKSQNLI